jgi:hypothetical protein
MSHALLGVAWCSGLFVLMSLLAFLGHRLGRRRTHASDVGHEGTGAITGATFALLGLLIAFMFSGALERLDRRRQLIVEETNAIGTAWLRLDFLPAPARPALHDLFRDYTASRARFFEKLPDPEAALAEVARSDALQHEIWKGAVAASTGSEQESLLMDGLNEMIDVTTARTVASRTHTHPSIFVTLFVVALVCALLAGYSASSRLRLSPVHVIGFAVITAFTVFIVLDIEYPRDGFVNLGRENAMLHELAERMR